MQLAVHPEPKVVEILDSIKGVFAAKGFDGASMQDLARSAGMSAGNFYRYFPSKNAIIEAMVELDLAHINDQFSEIMASSDPRGTFRRVIKNRIETIVVDDKGPLWAEIEAASGRRTEIAEISSKMQTSVVNHVARVFCRIARIPETEGISRFTPHAHLIFMLVKGVAMQGCGGRTNPEAAAASPEVSALVLRVIDQMLDEIAGSTATHVT